MEWKIIEMEGNWHLSLVSRYIIKHCSHGGFNRNVIIVCFTVYIYKYNIPMRLNVLVLEEVLLVLSSFSLSSLKRVLPLLIGPSVHRVRKPSRLPRVILWFIINIYWGWGAQWPIQSKSYCSWSATILQSWNKTSPRSVHGLTFVVTP